MNFIFQKESLSMIHGGMVSISKVSVTPDLLEAKIYLSLFKVENNKAALNLFIEKTPELRGALGNKLRHHLRRIPTLSFREDDTLEHVDKIENLFKKIQEEDQKFGSKNEEE